MQTAKQLHPLEVCALALAVAPDAREGSAVLAAMVARGSLACGTRRAC